MLSLIHLFFPLFLPQCFHALPSSLPLCLSLHRVCCITTQCCYHGNYGEQKDNLFYFYFICLHSLKFWRHFRCNVSLLVSTKETLSDRHTHKRTAGSDLIKTHTHTQSLSFLCWCRTPTFSTHFLSFVFPLSSIIANITTATRRLHWCYPWSCQ